MSSDKKTMYILMTIIVCGWGLEYVFAKNALENIETMTLVFIKYLIGATIILLYRIKKEGVRFWPRRQDVFLYFVCAIFGEIGYFYCEYSAMSYLPVSLITIILSFVPVVSLLIERILYKRKITKLLLLGVILCVVGVCLIIGADFETLLSGRLLGYLFAFGAVLSWNAYNFITASLHGKYSSVSLTANQLLCSILLLAPYAIGHMPAKEVFTAATIGGVVYLGVMGAAIAFLVQVRALHILGVTPTSIFSNFIPVTSTFFGWLFLGEVISPIQFVGGAIIIFSATLVIREKDKLDKKNSVSVETNPSESGGISES